MAASTSRFDRWASSYEGNTLQQYLYVPVHQTALQLAFQLLPHPRRVLDVGCGTGRLLRQARRCYPTAELVGVDLAGQMAATARAVTPPSWLSATSRAGPRVCRSPTRCST